MPKSYSKTQRKKTKAKIQPKPVNITTRKSYWITLTFALAVFAFVLGYSVNMVLNNIVLMLATVLSLIGFLFYLRFTPSTVAVGRRATFIFVGASIVGFSIWAMMVLSLNSFERHSQLVNALGGGFFAVTSLIICLISGAFIGDLVGKNKERISIFIDDKLKK